MRVPIKKLNDEAIIPKYQSEGAACMDLHAIFEHGYDYLRPGETKIFKTGLAMEIPEGYELQVRSRSGLASNGVLLANGVGTIDSDYRGDVGVILTNASSDIMKFETGDRIAQCKIEQVIPFEFYETCKELTETKRGTGGYGSTNG